ncbi:hypothetical protein M8044_000415 [Columbia Basin potato purple top phytoplasma]|uniref:Uncharacterized protein n=1 Tax=Columbia Basin potato purple top phytoplasma TaxID=307134 RepID=A0ABT5LCA9_9MOLU|nr:hypothetical protein [Columbia Basin potato purple top phytoplasma]
MNFIICIIFNILNFKINFFIYLYFIVYNYN